MLVIVGASHGDFFGTLQRTTSDAHLHVNLLIPQIRKGLL
jgi:hypothetical protein